MKLPFLIYLLLSFQFVVFAQEQSKRKQLHERVPLEQRVERQTKIMSDSLGLSDVQKSAISKINLKYLIAREELIESDISKQEKMFDMETLEIRQHKEFKKVLTKEQFKKLQTMEERRREIIRKKIKENRAKREK